MSNRAQRDRVTPWILFFALTLVVWLGLKLNSAASSAAVRHLGPSRESVTETPAVESGESGSEPGGLFREPEELPGLGDGVLPVLFDTLDDVDCDFDDPFGNCQ